MKILLVTPYFVPAISYGGPVKVAYDIARGLVAKGHEVTVVTTDVFDDRDRLKETTEVLEGIKILRFRNISNTFAKRFNGYMPLMFVPWLIKNAKHFDVIHCHDFFSILTIAVGALSCFHKVPYLIQPHGSLSSVRQRSRFLVVKRLFIRLFGGILSSSLNVIALTEEEKRGIVSIIPAMGKKVAIIPNGLDLKEFTGIEKVDLRARYKINEGAKVIGFVGRLSYIKGIDISLEALARIKDSVNFSFLVIGPDEGELSRLTEQAQTLGIGDRVIFTGILSGREKLQILKSCDLFIFTSRDEGLPMTVLEVAALGVPQVISKECNVPELAEYQAGYVHPFDDVPAFAASVEIILKNKPLQEVMGKNAQLMVMERFSVEKMVDGVEQLILRGAKR